MKKELLRGVLAGVVFGIYSVILAYANFVAVVPGIKIDLGTERTSYVGAITVVLTYTAIGTALGLIFHLIFRQKEIGK